MELTLQSVAQIHIVLSAMKTFKKMDCMKKLKSETVRNNLHLNEECIEVIFEYLSWKNRVSFSNSSKTFKEVFLDFEQVRMKTMEFSKDFLQGTNLKCMKNPFPQDGGKKKVILEFLRNSITNSKIRGWKFNKEEKEMEMEIESMCFVYLENGGLSSLAAFMYDVDSVEVEGNALYRSTLYLYELHVRNDEQGKGMGTSILKILEEECKKNDVPFIALTVNQNNYLAIEFYKKRGFRLDIFSPTNVDYYIFSKRIS